MYPQSIFLAKKKKNVLLFFSTENRHFYSCKKRCVLHRRVFVIKHTSADFEVPASSVLAFFVFGESLRPDGLFRDDILTHIHLLHKIMFTKNQFRHVSTYLSAL